MEKQKKISRFRGFKLLDSDARLLEKLPAHNRAALEASGSYEEIAATLGISIKTVRTRLHRARHQLQALRDARDGVA